MKIDRAQGCLLGQLAGAGDALGSLVEFQAPEQIRQEYPGGVRELADGGTWNTIVGQLIIFKWSCIFHNAEKMIFINLKIQNVTISPTGKVGYVF